MNWEFFSSVYSFLLGSCNKKQLPWSHISSEVTTANITPKCANSKMTNWRTGRSDRLNELPSFEGFLSTPVWSKLGNEDRGGHWWLTGDYQEGVVRLSCNVISYTCKSIRGRPYIVCVDCHSIQLQLVCFDPEFCMFHFGTNDKKVKWELFSVSMNLPVIIDENNNGIINGKKGTFWAWNKRIQGIFFLFFFCLKL